VRRQKGFYAGFGEIFQKIFFLPWDGAVRT